MLLLSPKHTADPCAAATPLGSGTSPPVSAARTSSRAPGVPSLTAPTVVERAPPSVEEGVTAVSLVGGVAAGASPTCGCREGGAPGAPPWPGGGPGGGARGASGSVGCAGGRVRVVLAVVVVLVVGRGDLGRGVGSGLAMVLMASTRERWASCAIETISGGGDGAVTLPLTAPVVVVVVACTGCRGVSVVFWCVCV